MIDTLTLAFNDLNNPTIRTIAQNLCDEVSGKEIVCAVDEILKNRTILPLSLPMISETLRAFTTDTNKIVRIKWLRDITRRKGNMIRLKTAKDAVEYLDPPQGEGAYVPPATAWSTLVHELKEMGWEVNPLSP